MRHGRSLAASDALWARAERVIPCGTQTLSKAPSQFVRGVYPKYLVSGRGCRVRDADGHDYIDYPMALGAVLLGHAYPPVVEAVERQARAGTLFTLMHPLEVEVAERLVELVPCAEMARFVKNGSDATAAAVRLARAYTGRERVAYIMSLSHQDPDIAETLTTVSEALDVVARALRRGTLQQSLEGAPAEPVFRPTPADAAAPHPATGARATDVSPTRRPGMGVDEWVGLPGTREETPIPGRPTTAEAPRP